MTSLTSSKAGASLTLTSVLDTKVKKKIPLCCSTFIARGGGGGRLQVQGAGAGPLARRDNIPRVST